MAKTKLSSLFIEFAKVGAVMFGGGYAMLAMMDSEFIEKRQWITEDELSNLTIRCCLCTFRCRRCFLCGYCSYFC